jgi:hypothetical protein
LAVERIFEMKLLCQQNDALRCSGAGKMIQAAEEQQILPVEL